MSFLPRLLLNVYQNISQTDIGVQCLENNVVITIQHALQFNSNTNQQNEKRKFNNSGLEFLIA